MKTKLRRFTAVLSAMLCMICCVLSAVPAFADDISTRLNDNNIADILQKNYKTILSNRGYTDDYAIACYWYCDDYGDRGILYGYLFYLIDKSYIGKTISDDSVDFISAFDCDHLDTKSKLLSDTSGTTTRGGKFLSRLRYDISHIPEKHFVFSNFSVENFFDGKDPNAPPTPFTVDYSPSLKTGLVRKGTLVAPGASNDGQEVETNSIAVTVKMTDAFLNASKPISGAYTYSYQFTCFVVPSEYKDSDIKTMSEHAIYTAAQDNLNYLYYENETLDVDDSLSSQPSTGESAPVSEQWANATGVSNCFLLERDNNTPLRNVTIDLHNIDFEKHKSDSYNIVVLGHIVRKSEYGWTAYPSFFKSDCSSLALESTKEYPMNFGSSEQPVVNKNFYDYYSVISDDWSFKDYPKFEPHKVGGVTVGDSPLDFKRTAKGVQDYNMWEQGGTDNTLKPDDFDKYKEQKKLDENFGSVDFGLDSIKSVFDGSSDFFKFLTASIGILPTTFLTILISFFVIMLAICVVKWVLK